MPNNERNIKKIQFKRGVKAVLESKLVEGGLGIPANGEPIFETDTGKLKIGDGVRTYKDLPYVIGDIFNFVIQDPIDNQILLYDLERQAWVNKDLTPQLTAVETKILSKLPDFENTDEGKLVKTSKSGLVAVDAIDILAERLNSDHFEILENKITLRPVEAKMIKVNDTTLDQVLTAFATKQDLQFALSWGNLDVITEN